jgi:hypothetical protein
MKARSAKGEKTRLRILEAARDLFHGQGVAATSPDQVIEASGTGKGQFYPAIFHRDFPSTGLKRLSDDSGPGPP